MAVMGLILGLAAPTMAQMGGIITTGTAVLGQSRHTYAVVFDPSCLPGYYIRIWLDGFRVMQLWPGEQRDNNTLMMYYHVYHTMGHHWTLPGGADWTRSWSPETAGELAMDGRTVPANTIGILTGYMGGRGRQTYRAHSGANVMWYAVRATWWNAQFYPGAVNGQMFQRWQQHHRSRARKAPTELEPQDQPDHRHGHHRQPQLTNHHTNSDRRPSKGCRRSPLRPPRAINHAQSACPWEAPPPRGPVRSGSAAGRRRSPAAASAARSSCLPAKTSAKERSRRRRSPRRPTSRTLPAHHAPT
jgi:hypothetical protein